MLVSRPLCRACWCPVGRVASREAPFAPFILFFLQMTRGRNDWDDDSSACWLSKTIYWVLQHKDQLMKLTEQSAGTSVNGPHVNVLNICSGAVINRGFNIAWILLETCCIYVPFKVILENGKLILHCKKTSWYRMTSSSTSITLGSVHDLHSIVQSSLDRLWKEKMQKKGDIRGEAGQLWDSLRHLTLHRRLCQPRLRLGVPEPW